LAAHSFIGEKLVKIDSESIHAARHGNASDNKTNAILQFAKTLVNKGGLVNDQDVNTAKAAGLTEAEIAETVAHVALNILTNYFNNTANTEVDFPQVAAL